jgi:hypothetical protein
LTLAMVATIVAKLMFVPANAGTIRAAVERELALNAHKVAQSFEQQTQNSAGISCTAFNSKYYAQLKRASTFRIGLILIILLTLLGILN